jgi:ABC-type multidrug transport system fused ATPase/permease subunit
MNRLSSDTATLQDAATSDLSMLLRYLIQILAATGLMFHLSWKLTLVLVAVVPVLAISALRYGRFIKGIRRKFQARLPTLSIRYTPYTPSACVSEEGGPGGLTRGSSKGPCLQTTSEFEHSN